MSEKTNPAEQRLIQPQDVGTALKTFFESLTTEGTRGIKLFPRGIDSIKVSIGERPLKFEVEVKGPEPAASDFVALVDSCPPGMVQTPDLSGQVVWFARGICVEHGLVLKEHLDNGQHADIPAKDDGRKILKHCEHTPANKCVNNGSYVGVYLDRMPPNRT